MGTLGMFDTAAVVLDRGTGWSDVAPLCAVDMAMHPQQQANFHQVTSLVPAGVPVFRIKDGAEMVRLDGAHIPAVMRWETGRGGVGKNAVSAGIAVGLPSGGETGVIYHDAGPYGPDQCEDQLRAMVTEGMARVRRVRAWDFQSVVATVAPGQGHPGHWYAAFAALTFLDAALLGFYQQAGVLVPA